MNFLAQFLAGMFLCNAIPHLAKGLQGEPFPTPFAKPRGVGNSTPLVNFLWGAVNLCIGLALVARFPLTIGANPETGATLAGALAIGVYLALHFGKVRAR